MNCFTTKRLAEQCFIQLISFLDCIRWAIPRAANVVVAFFDSSTLVPQRLPPAYTGGFLKVSKHIMILLAWALSLSYRLK